MVLTRKGISASSEAIIKEQRQITREKLLASPGLIIGTIGFLLILVTAILVPILNTQDPNAMVVMDRLKAPSAAHIFGTDELGRDLFIRVMYGARVSLWVGGCVAIFSCVLGTIIGLYASYFKVLDQILMRICDGLIAIPGILLAIALIAALGTSSWNVVVALTIVYTPNVARTVRASAMVIREQTYVTFPFSCTLFTIRFTSSKFIFLRISVIVSGLVDWIPISSWISPGRMDAISSISSSFNRSAATSKWKFVFPLSCSFKYVQIAME